VAQAVQQAGKTGKVAVIGYGSPNTVRQYIKSGIMKESILWDPKALGYLTVWAGKALAEGTQFHEDFLGAIVQVYGPKMLRYKGVLHMKGADRKVIFQGVHQLMGSDLGPKWAPGEKKGSKIVFIGIDLPKDILKQGLEQCLV
jgi:ABC-type sugar transport system substrate-binding protein